MKYSKEIGHTIIEVEVKRTSKSLEQVISEMAFSSKCFYISITLGFLCVLVLMGWIASSAFGVNFVLGILASLFFLCVIGVIVGSVYDGLIEDLIYYGYYKEFWGTNDK